MDLEAKEKKSAPHTSLAQGGEARGVATTVWFPSGIFIALLRA